jgi:nicotinamide-nucleotide amidase
MPTAEILTIGTEILLGEIQDTNTHFIARVLKDLGIDLYRTQTVGDNSGRISSIIQDILSRADILITTGGLGPTVDDPTRQAVADAVGVPLEFDPECWKEIQAYFERLGRRPMPENNRRQAYIPAGARIIANPVGTAPGFIVDSNNKNVISVPGVPKEMEYLILHTVSPYLQKRWDLHTVIRTKVIHVAGMGEGALDELVGEYELLSNPTVGLLAKPGMVDVRVGAKADTLREADRLIDEMVAVILPKLGLHVFGFDQTTLLEAATVNLLNMDNPPKILAGGFSGKLQEAFHTIPTSLLTVRELEANDSDLWSSEQDATLLAEFKPTPHPAELIIQSKRRDGKLETFHRKFGGPPETALPWAINSVLDILRLNLSNQYYSDSDLSSQKK